MQEAVSHPPRQRRSYGSGSLFVRTDARGRETWYGTWWSDGRKIKRRLGAKRAEGGRDGLTRAQAETELRRQTETERAKPSIAVRVTVEDAGERLIAHLEAMGRKPSTLRSYRSNLRTQVAPRLGERPVSGLRRSDVEAFIAACQCDGLAPKTISHCLGLLHSVFELAIRNGWAAENPCQRVDRPKGDDSTDIRFLDSAEVEALLRAVPDDDSDASSGRSI